MSKSWDGIEKRLRRAEKTRASQRERAEEVKQIDLMSYIAPVYYPLHEDVLNSCHEFYNLPGGRGSGKSSFCALEIIHGIMNDDTGQSNALVVRKFAVTLRSSVFAQLQWAIDALGVSARWKSTVSPLQFIYETGQTIKLTGLDDPQKLKSIKPRHGYFKYLWLEEFSEINGERELRNLQQSVLRGGQRFTVFRSFNPPISKSNWANAFVAVPDNRSITMLTDYRMIPEEWLGESFIEEAERLKEINPRAYEHEYLGLAIGSGGEVFPNLEVREITNEEIDGLNYIYQGLDWGFASDPFCFLRVAYDRKHDTVYILDEIYKKHCGNREIGEMILGRDYHYAGEYTDLYGDVFEEQLTVTCDSAEPKSIADLQEMGIKARKCHKEPGCVQYRVKWLQQRKIVVDPARTPEAHRELTNYEYETDKDGTFLSSLPDKDNHSIDALAYALDRLIYKRGVSA